MCSMTKIYPLAGQFDNEVDPLDEIYDEYESWDELDNEDSFLEFEEHEWIGETNRNSRHYVRWIQSSLNKILGLRLKVDGIMGPQTKSAIRSFQRKYGLATDGRVGSKTVRAIKEALAGKKSSALPTSPPQILQKIPPNTTAQVPEKIDKFDKDSSQLKNAHYTAIDRISHRIALSWKSGLPIPTVYVKGHASSEGKPQYNARLGQRRALAVRRALMKALENQQKNLSYKVLILAQSKGESEPVASNKTEDGRSYNRRVEVFLSTKVLRPIKPKVITLDPVIIHGAVPPKCNKILFESKKQASWKQYRDEVNSVIYRFVVGKGLDPKIAAKAFACLPAAFSPEPLLFIPCILASIGFQRIDDVFEAKSKIEDAALRHDLRVHQAKLETKC